MLAYTWICHEPIYPHPPKLLFRLCNLVSLENLFEGIGFVQASAPVGIFIRDEGETE